MSAEVGAALKITQGTILGFSYETENFGGEFRFGVRKNITIQIEKLDCGNKPTQGEIGQQANDLDQLANTQDYFELTVNGHTFSERWQLTNFTLNDGDWNQVTPGTITAQAFLEGSIGGTGGSDGDYAGWDTAQPEWQYLEDFSDNFSFNRSGNDISYEHSVSFKFSPIVNADDAQITPPIALGQKYATQMIEGSSRPAFNWLLDAATTQEGIECHGLKDLYSDINTDYKRFITETVDEINNTVTVSESFNAQNVVGDSDKYSFSAQQTFEITNNGIINVSEQGEVMGLLADGATRINPETYLDTELENATKSGGRMENIFNAHKQLIESESGSECAEEIPDLKTDESGNLILVQKGITRDRFKGTANYSITATNDQKIGEKAKHEYTRTIDALMSDASDETLPYYKISEQGKFLGISNEAVTLEPGQKAERPRFGEALEAWKNKNSTIKTELRAEIGADAATYPASLNNTFNPYKGEVSYTIEYSTEPKYGTESTSYKLKTFQLDDSLVIKDEDVGTGDNCLKQYTVQNVINHSSKSQILQTRNTTQLPSSSRSEHLVGKRNATLDGLLAECLGAQPDLSMANGPKTLKDCNYTFNAHNDKILDINFNWE